MGADVILDHLRHEPGHSATRARDQVHDLIAARFTVERALDGLDLAPDTAHTPTAFASHGRCVSWPKI
jgi:hypothetical protein